MTNIYDTVNQLAREFKDLPEFKNLKESISKVKENPESSELYEKFRSLSQEYQNRMMQGQEVSEEEMIAFQELAAKVQQDEHIQAIMRNEQMISQIINDINNIITKPLQEIYETKV